MTDSDTAAGVCLPAYPSAWSDAAIRRIYEQSFPLAEAMPADLIAAGIEDGRLRLHVTYKAGAAVCISVHRILAPDIAWLIFLATDTNMRSQGIGAQHMQPLKKQIACELGCRGLIVFEVESTRRRDLRGLTAEDRWARRARRGFYERLGAHTHRGYYEMLPFIEGQATTPAHLMWFGPQVPGRSIRLAMKLIYNCGFFPQIPADSVARVFGPTEH